MPFAYSDGTTVGLKPHQQLTFAAARFETATRGVDYPVTLTLATLPPGEYLLSFEARAGKATARRDVRFSIR